MSRQSREPMTFWQKTGQFTLNRGVHVPLFAYKKFSGGGGRGMRTLGVLPAQIERSVRYHAPSNPDLGPFEAAWGAAVEEVFGKPVLELYPLASWAPHLFEHAPGWMGMSADPGELTRVLFGKTRYRKDLVRAVAAPTTTIESLMYARAYRGLVPTDWLVDMLNAGVSMNQGDGRSSAAIAQQWRTKVLLHANERTLRRLAKDPAQVPGYVFDDTLRMMHWGEDHREQTQAALDAATGVADLHNALTPVQRQRWGGGVYTPPVNKPISASSLATKIAGPVGDWTIVLPDDTDQVRAWGEQMHHCIGTYAGDAERGKTILFAVLNADGTMAANGSIDTHGKRLTQLLGKYNAKASDELWAAIEAHMATHGMTTDSTYH